MTRATARRESLGHAAERALIARIAAGDRTAFATLYRAYTPRLHAFLARLLRGRAPVEEAIDDTMLVVWRKAACFDGRCAPSTWVFAIAYRKALKAIARARAARPRGRPVRDDAVCGGPENEVHRRQLQARLAAALARLSASHHAVVGLVYLQGYACREAAGILRCPVDTVKTRMFHARRRMRTLLASERRHW